MLLFLLAAFYFSLSSPWHIYDDHELPEKCKSVKSSTNLSEILLLNGNKWKLWPDLLSDFDKATGETIYGFGEAMEAIWRHQHPVDCSKAKFLISEGWAQGFGSEVHVVGVGLAIALNANRIFMMNPEGPLKTDERDNSWQVKNKFCQDQGKNTLECYYEPWTNCSIQDALQGRTISDYKQLRVTYFSDTDFYDNEKKEKLYAMNDKTLLLEHRGDTPLLRPNMFDDLLSCSRIKNTFTYHYWWRAVSASYLLRPNAVALSTMKPFHQKSEFDHNSEQCVSLYVRRGDKHVEMHLSSVFHYLEAAKMMWDNGLVPGPGGSNGVESIVSGHRSSPAYAKTSRNTGTIFLGTEDSSVIRTVETWCKEQRWKLFYTNMFDRDSVDAGANWTIQTKNRRSGAERHHNYEYLSMLLNLENHMRCNAFVCTMPSNFCRLIDELRASVGGKANRHYADIGETCTKIPCMDHQIKELGW